MGVEAVFSDAQFWSQAATMPVTRALSCRFGRLRPFTGHTVVFGHLLVWNSLVVAEALWRGGAKLVFTDVHASPATRPVQRLLERNGVRVWPAQQAVRQGDIYLDVGAALGQLRPPVASAEVTRTGVLRYQSIRCRVVSADDCLAKRVEGFFGTGDSFLRAWSHFRPGETLPGRRLVIFGYGKIGRGVAVRTRAAGMRVRVVDTSPRARKRAQADGIACHDGSLDSRLRRWLRQADIVIAVTGTPAALGDHVPQDWLRASHPVLVNLGAEDEFGPGFSEKEILGGRSVPLNFHLPEPTLNRYVDPALAAHLLALEVALSQPLSPGVHPLPAALDRWVLQTWRAAWPEEDLTGIGRELGLQ
jgi:adenosylhomocysteinase